MRYVPEELYLTWKERAEVSRKYALELLKAYEETNKLNSKLNLKNWLLDNEIQELRRQPAGKTYKRPLKTRDRLWKAKEHSRQLEEKLKQITDVLTDKNGSN